MIKIDYEQRSPFGNEQLTGQVRLRDGDEVVRWLANQIKRDPIKIVRVVRERSQ